MKPKYSFIKNTKYALEGMYALLRYETSFKIEILVCIVLCLVLYWWDIKITYKAILFASMMLVLITEAINSAIEAVVDLCTTQFHILAKRAKDIGSSAVFLSIVLSVGMWGFVLFDTLFGH
ncbi:MAG: diacylglycerol kinase [Epsilonproteobacteria bacterium]|nr:diacylglycerol kinase [Campylobacterota bacterium]